MSTRIKILVISIIPLLIYFIWLTPIFQNPKSAYSFIIIGQKFVTQSTQSETINKQYQYAYKGNNVGYDGQFYYYSALDPLNSPYYMDHPFYRYPRILYPLIARTLAFGNSSLIPFTLLVTNIFSIFGTVIVLGKWLQKQGISPRYSLIYGLFPGLFIATVRDLSEPTAYFFAMLGIYFFEKSKFKNIFMSSIFFCAAFLTREVTILFAIPLTISLLTKNVSQRYFIYFIFYLGIILLPFFLINVYLHIINISDESTYTLFNFIPLDGFISLPANDEHTRQLVSVVAPSLIALFIGLHFFLKKHYLLSSILVLNILFLVIFLTSGSYLEYNASGRIITGIILALVLSIKYINRYFWNKILFWIAILLYFRMWIFVPSILSKSYFLNIMIWYSTIFVVVTMILYEIAKHTNNIRNDTK